MIRIPVRQETESVAVRAKQKAALKLWDELREDGLGKWNVLYCQTGACVERRLCIFRPTHFGVLLRRPARNLRVARGGDCSTSNLSFRRYTYPSPGTCSHSRGKHRGLG